MEEIDRIVEEAEKYKGKRDDSEASYNIYFLLFQLRMRMQQLVSLQRMASNHNPSETISWNVLLTIPSNGSMLLKKVRESTPRFYMI
jgi:hypothetical protein